ncbi:MAG: polyprenyl synthetase family protein [Clostridia bacterium]|nr:polyprenyl synthetase family protein [Clostridia bacterium]
MNIEQHLAKDVQVINDEIEALCQRKDPDFAPVLDAMAYSLLAPRAKRIRPVLTLAFCRLFGGDLAAALPCAVALEMVHTYSLIHDDLPCMDNDELRRGRPTCHVAYGEATALLSGDALLTRAFEVLGENTAMSDRTVRDAVQVLARAAGAFGMIGGQVIDLAGEKEILPLLRLLKLHENKTGALIVASALLGCLSAGLTLSDERTKAAKRYAEGIGLAFQIVDDVIDATATVETAGKSVGSDQKQHKTTFLSYYTAQEALAYAHRVSEEAKMSIASFEGNEFLLELADYLIKRKF